MKMALQRLPDGNEETSFCFDFISPDERSIESLADALGGHHMMAGFINALARADLAILERARAPKPYKTYLMRDGTNGLWKIGKAIDPHARERILGHQVPGIMLIAVCASDIERKLHREYDSKRVHGEWFRLEQQQVELIIQQHDFIRH